MDQIRQDRPWLRRYTWLMIAATLLLIYMGGQVKSHEAGLSVPDWPTTFGVNMFLFHWSEWQGGIFHEHTHRLVASAVGFMTIILMVWILLVDTRPWVRRLSVGALLAVIAQGLLGGLTVLMHLPVWVSSSHATLAQIFLLLLVLIAYSQSRERARRESNDTASGVMQSGAMFFIALVFLQLILGAVMRHTESGLAIPDFPATAGNWLPIVNADALEWANAWRLEYSFDSDTELLPVTLGQMVIHLSHRIGALVLVIVAIAFTVNVLRRGQVCAHLRGAVLGLDLLLILQATLGAFTIWTHKYPVVTSLHVVTGAAVLAWATLIALRATPLSPSQEAARVARSTTVSKAQA